MARIKVYNPGRDTRWGSTRAPQPSRETFEMGTLQRQQFEAGVGSWYRWRRPLHRLDKASQRMAVELAERYQEYNLLVEENGEVYWYLWWARPRPQLETVPAWAVPQLEAMIQEANQAAMATG